MPEILDTTGTLWPFLYLFSMAYSQMPAFPTVTAPVPSVKFRELWENFFSHSDSGPPKNASIMLGVSAWSARSRCTLLVFPVMLTFPQPSA